MAYSTVVTRHKTREVGVGDHVVGGENPIWVQSMTTTNTFDVDETVAQIHRLEEAGCEIVRVTVPKKEDVEACKPIRVADQDPLDRRHPLRLPDGPGLPRRHDRRRPARRRQDPDQSRATSAARSGSRRSSARPRDKGIPMRIGVNSGSLEKDLIDKYGFPCPEAMVESALRSHRDRPRALGYREIIVSLKASHVPTAVECYTPVRREVRLSDPRRDHRGRLEGVRHAQERRGDRGDRACEGSATRSASRCWATRFPRSPPAFDILRACDRRVNRPEVVACPTCGRLDIDLERIVAEVEAKMAHLKDPLRISILGCLVNGFGEAKEADLGIAAGAGKGIIFKRGVPIRHVKEAEMVEAPLEEVGRFAEETPALKSHQEKRRRRRG